MADPAWLAARIRDVPGFPRAGIVFKDITPLLADAAALSATVEGLVSPRLDAGVDKVVGIEARGFILAAPVALALGAGFVPVRKAGKLPAQVRAESYDLEYGTDTLEVHDDALAPGERVLIVDDVIATGGTAAATARLVEGAGAVVAGLAFVIELASLAGRERLAGYPTSSLVTFP